MYVAGAGGGGGFVISTRVGISLRVGCDFASCVEFAVPLHRQLSSGKYDECSVLEIPGSIGEWRAEHRTARKRADRCERRGYRFGRVRRRDHADAVHAINRSAPHRQGRPMSVGYLERPRFGSDEYPCPMHGVHAYGIFDRKGILAAYLWMYRAGELALVSQILGHAGHLDNEVMYLLFQGALEREIEYGSGVVVYNRHDSGTDGLRFFKERLGFRPVEVEWLS